MKKTIAISLLALTTSVNAQIKIFPGGSVTYGATSTTLYAKHHFVGNFLAVTSQSNTPNGAALIRGNNSNTSAALPEYTWLGNDLTGIYHPGSDLIGITINASEKFRFNTNGQILSSATQATATPAYSWNNDANTGIYNPAADVIGFVTNGGEKIRINSNGQLLNSVSNTSASLPDFSWSANPNTGIYRPQTNTIGFTLNGIEKWRMVSNGQLLNMNTLSSATTPDYTWFNDYTTGVFHPASNVIGFAIGGSEAMRIHNSKKVFIGAQPRTDSTWLDGQLTIANISDIERALVIKHSATSDWKNAVSTTLTRSLSTTYGVTYNGNATFYVAGAGWIYSQGSYLGSDVNIKDDIKTIDNASAKINQLKGVTYKLKKEKQSPALYGGTAQEYMGVIAQDVEKVAPQAVKTIHDGTKAVSYEMLIGLLIQGFKEQSAKITQLESDLNACCTKNGGSKTTQRTINTTNNNSSDAPTQSYLMQNKPNPFNKETIIEYNIIEEGNASILIFDMNGKLLKTIGVKIPGQGLVTINAKDLSAGMYYYSLIVNDNEVDTKKMIITE